MLKIRLQRTGKRGQAYFRLVVLEHTKKPKGEFLELLGSYDPHKKVLNVKKERIDYWLSKGTQISATANNLLINNKIIDRTKMLSWKPKTKAPTSKPETETKAPSQKEAPSSETPPQEAIPTETAPSEAAPSV